MDVMVLHGLRSANAERLPVEATFAKKMAGIQDADDGFLALLGNHGHLDLA
jgi:hypothetical protein